MDKEPEISIVVPIYNCDKFLRGCLQSVLDQTFDSYERTLIRDVVNARIPLRHLRVGRRRVLHRHPT